MPRSYLCIYEIENGKYHAVLVNLKELMKDGEGFKWMWKNNSFTLCIISVVWDEAHCISAWNSFQLEYKQAHHLCYYLHRWALTNMS